MTDQKRKYTKTEKFTSKKVKVKDLPEVMEISLHKSSRFKPEFYAKARELYDKGCTDAEVAKAFGVSRNTIMKWGKTIPKFTFMKQKGHDMRLAVVEAATMLRITGYDKDESYTTVYDKEGNVKEVRVTKRHYPGDPGLIKFMLMNLDPDHYREKADISMPGMESLFERLANKRTELEKSNLLPSDQPLSDPSE